jgi:hypothetical protein
MINAQENCQILNPETILQPVTRVFEDVTNTSNNQRSPNISQATAKTIQEMFPEQEFEDKSIQKAKIILGDLATEFSKEDLRDLVAQVEYLAESWLDDFERDVFNGKTLNELLHDRGGI